LLSEKNPQKEGCKSARADPIQKDEWRQPFLTAKRETIEFSLSGTSNHRDGTQWKAVASKHRDLPLFQVFSKGLGL
jgi:hypothetical protein